MHTASSPIRVSPAAGRPGIGEFADRLIRQSGARPADRVLIVGEGRAELLLSLYGRGFAEVCHAAVGRLPVREAFDIVWLLGMDSRSALHDALAGLGRALRPGGVLVVQSVRTGLTGLRARDVRQRFALFGLVPLVQSSDGADGLLISAHRPSTGAAHWPATA